MILNMNSIIFPILLTFLSRSSLAFHASPPVQGYTRSCRDFGLDSFQLASTMGDDKEDISNMASARFPTSPEDQIRQAAISLNEATAVGKTRHSIRLLLPIIGATELDDWPGGARQMAEAASPLIRDMLLTQDTKLNIQETVIEQSDGVRALFCQGDDPKADCCAVLLPSADTADKLQELDGQVGEKRNLIVVNSQWKRKSDFGANLAFFGSKRDEKVTFVEGFEPTFHCSNVMVEGDIIRILRSYPGPWRVYLRTVDPEDEQNVDWIEIGTKEYEEEKTTTWEKKVKEQGDNDGGKIFDYGIPSYDEIADLIKNREGYVPKSLSERASSAFTFIKDTL